MRAGPHDGLPARMDVERTAPQWTTDVPPRSRRCRLRLPLRVLRRAWEKEKNDEIWNPEQERGRSTAAGTQPVARILNLVAAIERTLTRAKADAIIASTLHEENSLVRRSPRGPEYEPGGRQLKECFSPSAFMFVCYTAGRTIAECRERRHQEEEEIDRPNESHE